MSEAKHTPEQNWTPEPWNYWNENREEDDDGYPVSTFNVQDAGGNIIAVCDDGWSREPGESTEANAARIVACVNALRGLDVAKVESLLDAVRAWADLPTDSAPFAFDRANEALDEAFDALADSIRAGGAR